jgi:hypothetical protein
MPANVRRIIAIAAILSTVLLSSTNGTGYADAPLEQKILALVAEDHDAASQQLEIAELTPLALPHIDLTLYQAKVIDTATGDIYGVVVDGEGTPQDLEAAQTAERETREALYGPMTPALYHRLQTLDADEKVVVGIWLRSGNLAPPTRQEIRPSPGETGDADLQPQEVLPPGFEAEEKTDQEAADSLSARVQALQAEQEAQRERLEALHQATITYLADQMTGIQADLLTDLQARGIPPLYASPIAPLVYVEVSQAQALSLAQRADIDTLYGPNDYADAMDVAKVTQKADVIDAWGYEGTGVNVAILEDSRIETANPYLNVVDTRVSGDSNVDQHATATGGMVASQEGTYEGIAQDVNLYSANATTYGDTNLSAAMDWAATTIGVDIINNSWGGNAGNTNLNVHDRHLDYIVRNIWATVTVAAGNENGACGSGTGRVTSPGRAYNVITVGNYFDSNSETRSDDGIASCSSYIDPSTGIGKPEVAGSGSSIISTTDADPWIGNVGSGTSYAAPMVAGQAALLMERSNTLKNLPEAVKAIIMATALHNIEGDSRFSDYDGAGGVDMRAAFNLVDQGLWAWDSVNSDDFPYSHTYFAFAGETVRAAIAWDSNPASDYSSDPLDADIDLRIYEPDGDYVTGSTSFSDSYEIVEFIAAETGLYEMRISDFRFDGTTEYIGAAWWPGHRVLQPYVPQTLGTPPVSYHNYRFPAVSYWNAVGIRSPSGSDYDIDVYSGSPFGDPEEHEWLEDSSLGGTAVDVMLVDRNHAPSSNYYAEVTAYAGSGFYPIEWATHTADLYSRGRYGPYSMGSSDVVRVWDLHFEAGQHRTVRLEPLSSDLDLAMALFDSDPSDDASWYQGRSQAVAVADANGSGGGEVLEYTNTGSTDWLGLIVYSKGGGTSADFQLFVDYTIYLPMALKD